jgi:hypothetical protein
MMASLCGLWCMWSSAENNHLVHFAVQILAWSAAESGMLRASIQIQL